MSLHKKTFIFTASLIGIAILGIIAASRTILVEGYVSLEKTQIERNLARVSHSLQQVISEVEFLNRDWAQWDDAYQFVQDRNQRFIDVNLVDQTFSSARLNAIVFVDNEGRIVYEKGYDLGDNRTVLIPESLKSHINRQDILITHVGSESISGIINSNEGPMMVSSFPILKSDRSGPAQGTIIMARLIDEEVIEKVENAAQFPLEFINFDNSPFSPEDSKGKTIIQYTSAEIVSGFTPILDIYGKPSLVIKIDMEREIVNQGEKILLYFLLATILIGSIVVAGGIYFQDRTVLAPIHRLSSDVLKIRSRGNLTERVRIVGKDEIARLAGDVNAMLTSLQEYQGRTRESEKKLSERLKVIEKQNEDLEKTKNAMANLLEDERQLEETLKKEHDRLDLIISSMGEGLLVIDKDHILTAINPVAEKLLEVKKDGVVGKKWSDLVITLKNHSATPTEERSFSKAIKEGKTIVTSLEEDHSYKTKSGKIFPVVSITAPLEVEGEIVGAVKVFRDATKEKESRKLIEQEIRDRTQALWEERARMVSSIDSLQMGFIIANKNHEIVVKNPAVTDILGIPEAEVSLDRIAQELQANLDLKAQCEECLSKKTSIGRDDIYYKDKFLRIFLAPVIVKEQDDAAIGYVLLIEDVTSEKQLIRAKDEFFAVASHELRTPLTAIRGNTSLIIDYFAEKIQDTDLKEMISDMHESSVRLINIVNDFLDASRLEQGKVELKPEEIDLVEVMRGVIDELDDFASQKGISIKVNGTVGEMRVWADKARTQQVGSNLIGNAIKFSKQGEVAVNFEKEKDFVKVRVTDNGIGISPANQRLLFKKFQQAGERVLARDVTKGTGMGLYISKLLTELMGGKIYLENSEFGKGSTFAFELPVKK
ncbi:hypothetical protein A2962_03625 [Candidatus Woesebacteria bacterium RIFCSPLOWO2_01_FULL_39_61]|uniref:histidine kinase n=1 Tax=Candidatus Woesebacteria bacterium RIFCSPHIGHO2_02_FULL_39_13 TaxID=1802505 RepID=A0A1F7YZ91_9BACT|nr:MAG: hypothetical protein A2692_04030 [Candidatus Woesebacteria bacterium RIFCSPHIGHO2_01_FULL_39_95]OGM32540.1 MAG: hypothetical protein A3D01_01780 [Candidatus Woesebacteria bacterium RIFCSPHIGHO2_02_FULL_39_13]OGM37514.1 MAG: hypothetical protein A3E13_02675 [Candidatus Woesebacteria bacterium RIFCSPHIGHO2_12_FULL_40_20]OGM68193.1 MAG: hypothetical protein A2962_03625 [Candidatus Woesebacteria bacterium RIFCSPLOWO2_01_FULL_39_61]OGM74968.1 MAG: hypothetical protein A3H19_02350 [Candidatus